MVFLLLYSKFRGIPIQIRVSKGRKLFFDCHITQRCNLSFVLFVSEDGGLTYPEGSVILK